MRLCWLALVSLLLVAACGGDDAPDVLPGGLSSDRVTLRPAGTIDGSPLGYVEYLPPGYGDGDKRPLLVFLHGADENGDGSEKALGRVFELGVPMLLRNDDWPDERPFIVLAPQYPPEEAEECRHADEIHSFLEFAMDHYDADESRVYLTAVSCGAIGAWEYLGAHGDEIVAGAVLIAGHATSAIAEAGCGALARVPVWAFHGGVDDTVPTRFIAEPMAALEACTELPPADMRLTIYPRAGHDAWTRTYDLSAGHDVYAWLLGHEHP